MKLDKIQTNRFTMNYCQFGHGSEPLVVLPGVSAQRVLNAATAIEQAYQPLTDACTLYFLERRNDMPAAYSVYEMAADTAEAIQALGLTSVNLFGASQGGMIAMKIAIDHPERVKRLILGSASASITDERYHSVFEPWVHLAKTGEREALNLSFGKAVYPASVYDASRAFFVESAKAISDEDLKRFIAMTEGLRGFNVVDDLKKIACPVLVIGSRDDQVVGGDASPEIAAHLKNGQLYMYDHYGHAAYDVAPDYTQRLLRFIALERE